MHDESRMSSRYAVDGLSVNARYHHQDGWLATIGHRHHSGGWYDCDVLVVGALVPEELLQLLGDESERLLLRRPW